MRVRSPVTAILTFASLAGCVSLPPPGPTSATKRWVRASQGPEWAPPTVDVASVPGEATPGQRLKDLPGEAGAAIAAALAAKIDDADAYRAAVAGGLKPAGGPRDQVAGAFSRALVVSIARPPGRSADYLDYAEVTIKAQNFQFTDLTATATDYKIIDVAAIKLGSTRGLSASIDPKFGSDLIGSGSFGATLSSSREDSANLKERTETLSVLPKRHELVILQRGTVDRDLTGNVISAVTIALSHRGEDQKRYRPVIASITTTDKEGAPLKPGAAKTTVVMQEDLPDEPLWACVSLRYVDHEVVAGEQYRERGRQTVVRHNFATPYKAVEIVPANEVVRSLWTLRADKMPLKINTLYGMQEVAFYDPLTAERVLQWARNQPNGGPDRIGSSRFERKPNWAAVEVSPLVYSAGRPAPRSCPRDGAPAPPPAPTTIDRRPREVR